MIKLQYFTCIGIDIVQQISMYTTIELQLELRQLPQIMITTIGIAIHYDSTTITLCCNHNYDTLKYDNFPVTYIVTVFQLHPHNTPTAHTNLFHTVNQFYKSR